MMRNALGMKGDEVAGRHEQGSGVGGQGSERDYKGSESY
jgi:hypothetical protein